MVKFKKLQNPEHIPYHLLLLADETKDAIDKYVFISDIYIILLDNSEVGVFCLYPVSKEIIELKNIGLLSIYRQRGIGSKTLAFIKQVCKKEYKVLLVGTGDANTKQIDFYGKNDFLKHSIRKNFFIENYPDPIFDNGKQLVDMVVLKHNLEDK